MPLSEDEAAGRSGVGSAIARFWSARVDRHSAVGLRLTLGIVVCAAAVWAFAGLLEEVLDDAALVRWDVMASTWVHEHGTSSGLAIFDAITMLGSVGVCVLIVVVAGWLWRAGHRLLFTAWLGTNVGGVLLQLTLKRLVHRTRPEYAAGHLHIHSFSFPSGHAMQSTIAYLMLVIIASVASPWWRARRTPLIVAAASLVLLIGYSRVYLGAHYPSDVVGGVAAGTAWLSAALTLLGLVRVHRTPAAGVIADIPSSQQPRT